MNPEIDSQRHLDFRAERLKKHEEMRLDGDRARRLNQLDEAKTIYERAVAKSSRASSPRYEKRTKNVVCGWANEGWISPEEATDFLKLCDLGYLGETRVQTVSATSRLNLADEGSEKEKWFAEALSSNFKYRFQAATAETVNQTIHGHAIHWPLMFWVDRANVFRVWGDKRTAVGILAVALISVAEKIKKIEDEKLLTAINSDGGVAYCLQARILEELRREGTQEASSDSILAMFKDGRSLVDQATRKDHNYERRRAVEVWYNQYLLDNRNFRELLATLPTWFWLARKHAGTRQMFKDGFRQIWRKISSH